MGEIHFSSWDSFPDYYAEWKLHKDDMRYPSGECGQDVWERCSCLLNKIIRSNASHVAIVTHGGTIRVIHSFQKEKAIKLKKICGRMYDR